MIVTFYSFKGGVGRSMALANIGAWLYRQGRRVLLVDWDLEAPGLESFFVHGATALDEMRGKPGLMDLIESYRQMSTLSSSGKSQTEVSNENAATKSLGTIRHLFQPLAGTPMDAISTKNPGLWLLHAGCRTGASEAFYRRSVHGLDWGRFYDENDGYGFIEWLRRELDKDVDFVLLDSRTGVTEMGGVCTQHLADVVVVMFAPNDSNLQGARRIAELLQTDKVKTLRGPSRPLTVIPIPTRVDTQGATSHLVEFESQFRKAFEKLSSKSMDWCWDSKIRYVTSYSYEESVVTLEETGHRDLRQAYERIGEEILRLHEERLSPQEREYQARARSSKRPVQQEGSDRSQSAIQQLISLARSKMDGGDFKTASSLLSSAVTLARQDLGEEHPDTLSVMNNLAAVLYAQGDLNGAREVNMQVLDVQRRTLGPSDPATLASMSNLANLLLAQGELPAAESLYRDVLTSRLEVLGEDDPDTLASMGNLAGAVSMRGDLKLARELQERALAANRRVLGETHPNTLRAMRDLAMMVWNAGDRETARRLLEETLALSVRTLGEEHPDTLGAMRSLAMALANEERFADARGLLERAVSVGLKVAGEEHPDTLQALLSLASVLRSEGKHTQARPLLERVVAISARVFGKQHGDTSYAAALLYTSFEGDDPGARHVLEEHLLWLLDREVSSLPAAQQQIRSAILTIFRNALARWVVETIQREDGGATGVEGRPFGASSGPLITVGGEDANFRTIADAVRAAAAGSRIMVNGPAEYRESLRVDKPLELIGLDGATLVGVTGPAITSTGAAVRILGLRIRAEGFNGVTISDGYCVLEGAEVSACRYSAVLAKDQAEAAVIRCSLHHAEHCGVHAQLGSRCIVAGSTIRDNRVGGLFYSQGAEGLVAGNLIENNGYNGIFIAAGANPQIVQNRIRGHSAAGVLVYQHDEWRHEYGPGRGVVEENEITDGGQFGVQIEDGADPCVRGNLIRANRWGGVWTRKRGRGTICQNRIIGNFGAGIKNEEGHPLVGANVFEENAGTNIEDHGGLTHDERLTCQPLKKVLWVDDNPAYNDGLVDHYRARGIGFDLAVTTERALEFLERGEYALIISDIARGEDWDAGVRMLPEIQRRFPQAPPVIIYAHPKAVEAHGDKAKSLGASLVTASPDELMHRLNSLLVG